MNRCQELSDDAKVHDEIVIGVAFLPREGIVVNDSLHASTNAATSSETGARGRCGPCVMGFQGIHGSEGKYGQSVPVPDSKQIIGIATAWCLGIRGTNLDLCVQEQVWDFLNSLPALYMIATSVETAVR
jgi:hypothetical protein